MKKLNRMLIRDIMKSKGQFIAAAAVIFVGILMYVACYMSYENLKNSVAYYYEQYHFLDYYAEAQHISPQAVNKVKSLEGVKEAEGRISVDIGADMGDERRVTIRLISVPDFGHPLINDVLVRSGKYLNPDSQNVCLVSEKFANANQLERGKSIKLIVDGQISKFRIDGIVESPEFIYPMRSMEEFSPSYDDFGIVYIKESMAQNLLGYESAYNQLHVIFEESAIQEPIINKIEKILKPYGFTYGTKRKDQLSDAALASEIDGLASMAYAFPTLFLTVAAIIIYIMQRRLISNQRTAIGILKASGYSNTRMLWHYILYSLFIGVIGAIPGMILGGYLSAGMTLMYKDVLSLPIMYVKIYWGVMFSGAFISIGFCLVAGYNSAKRIMKIRPAEAMRAESPKVGKKIFLERIQFIWNRINFGWKMSIRNIFRSRQRSLFSIVGVSFTIMFFIVCLFMLDCVDFIFDQHFLEMQKQDYTVAFSQPVSYYDTFDLKTIDGIKKVEPIIEVPVEVRKGWRKETTMVIGTAQDTVFSKFIDTELQPIKLPEKGIMIAEVLADKLDINPGDTVIIRPFLGSFEEKEVKVAGIIKQYLGFNCYMNIDELTTVVEQPKFATSALINTETHKDNEIKEELIKMSAVESVDSRLDNYYEYMDYMKLTYTFIGLMVVFGIIMGFAIIYNITVINIMERRRELASLKVLGYTSKEIERVMFRENMFLGILSLLPGIMLGILASKQMAESFSSDLFVLELIIYPRTYVITLICTFAFIVFAQWANRNKIFNLDMVEVLKNREG